LALDAYEDAAKANHTNDRRHRIEAIETITAQDIRDLANWALCELSALHAEPNVDATNVWARNAGPDRASAGGLGRASQNPADGCIRQ